MGLPESQRRAFIRRGLSATTLAMVAASGLLLPQKVLAAHWPTDAFDAAFVEDVLRALMGEAEDISSSKVKFMTGKPANLVTDGRSVSVGVETTLPAVDRMALIVDGLENPLVMTLDMNPAVRLPLKTRIKLLEGESTLKVIVRSEGKLYQAEHKVRAYMGGL